MTAPYLLIPIFAILTILYGISLLFNAIGILPKILHRKIWNYLLLATFLVAAVLGTLMAIQVNYKIEVPWTEKVLKWHVNFGIAMSAVGIFHFLWHWRYYLPFVRKRGSVESREESVEIGGKEIGEFLLPFGTGFISIAFQALMIRELLSLFNGNELMVSILMSLWFILTGAGAFAGNRKISGEKIENRSNILLLYLILLPFILIPLLFYLRALFFLPGIEPGPAGFGLFLLIILLPYCFLSGFAFTYAVRLGKDRGRSPGWVYRTESIGAATGGLITTLLILFNAFSLPGAGLSEKSLHGTENLVSTRSGPSGRITVTNSGGQTNIYENGQLASSTGSTIAVEESVHFTMAQNPSSKRILIIGGILSGIPHEMLKYSVEQIDMAETDRNLVRLAGKLGLLPEEDPRIFVVQTDILSWLNHPHPPYDAVLILLPGPVNLNNNRFYSREFFKKVKSAMAVGGVLSVMMQGTANYVSEDALKAMGPVFSALSENFGNVEALSSENTFLTGSDHSLDKNILAAMDEMGIKGQYLSQGYFDEVLFKTRSEELTQMLRRGYQANSAMSGKAFFGQINWWLGHYPVRILWAVAAILIIILATSLFKGRSSYTVMFSLGAGTSGLSLVLLLLIQMAAGAFYLLAGIAAAVFMTGLAIGSSNKVDGKRKRLNGGLFYSALFAIIPMVVVGLVPWFRRLGGGTALKLILILFLMFAGAWAAGKLFVELTHQPGGQEIAGRIYAYDLMGSALGALVFPLALLPLAGLPATLGIVSLTGIVSLILFLVRGRSGGN